MPSTIHRLLGFNPGNSTRYRHGPSRPLPYDVVVVDEASMVDLPMMARLVEAVDPDARLILLGDRDQLASVEAGSVLADLTPHRETRLGPAAVAALRAIDPACLDAFHAVDDPSALPTDAAGYVASRIDEPVRDGVVRYSRGFRFKDHQGIGQVAYAIASGDPGRLERAVGWLTGASETGEAPFDDLEWIADDGAAPSPATVDRLAEAWRPAVQAARAWREGDDLGGVVAACDRARVLCAHRRGPRGVEGLNQAIRRALATRLRVDLTAPIAPGVPVMVTENRYDLGLMNGDVGVAIDGASGPEVAFQGPSGPRRVPGARMPAFEPVFAMTIHKSQGSQFKQAIVVLPSEISPLLTRELIYTGITRASDRVVIVGGRGVLRAGLERVVARSGRLRERIAAMGRG
jgi:exodeoxyribonuclease V alpha subunit